MIVLSSQEQARRQNSIRIAPGFEPVIAVEPIEEPQPTAEPTPTEPEPEDEPAVPAIEESRPDPAPTAPPPVVEAASTEPDKMNRALHTVNNLVAQVTSRILRQMGSNADRLEQSIAGMAEAQQQIASAIQKIADRDPQEWQFDVQRGPQQEIIGVKATEIK